MGLNIIDCYKKGDKQGLLEIAETTIDMLLTDLENYKNCACEEWHSNFKMNGFEVWDIRISGVIGRLHTVKRMLTQYTNGEIPSLDEILEERIPVLGEGVSPYYQYLLISSAGKF